MKLLISLYLLIFSTLSYGNCVCRCVNGEMTPLCSSSIDLPPICPPTICPIVPPSVQPINPPVVPPIGTSRCEYQQVINPRTGYYEWRNICR